jgi:hypothetical protein
MVGFSGKNCSTLMRQEPGLERKYANQSVLSSKKSSIDDTDMSCDSCNRLQILCNNKQPSSQCIKYGNTCVYDDRPSMIEGYNNQEYGNNENSFRTKCQRCLRFGLACNMTQPCVTCTDDQYENCLFEPYNTEAPSQGNTYPTSRKCEFCTFHTSACNRRLPCQNCGLNRHCSYQQTRNESDPYHRFNNTFGPTSGGTLGHLPSATSPPKCGRLFDSLDATTSTINASLLNIGSRLSETAIAKCGSNYL